MVILFENEAYCPKCNGTGEYQGSFASADTNPVKPTCEYCDGIGKVRCQPNN